MNKKDSLRARPQALCIGLPTATTTTVSSAFTAVPAPFVSTAAAAAAVPSAPRGPPPANPFAPSPAAMQNPFAVQQQQPAAGTNPFAVQQQQQPMMQQANPFAMQQQQQQPMMQQTNPFAMQQQQPMMQQANPFAMQQQQQPMMQQTNPFAMQQQQPMMQQTNPFAAQQQQQQPGANPFAMQQAGANPFAMQQPAVAGNPYAQANPLAAYNPYLVGQQTAPMQLPPQPTIDKLLDTPINELPEPLRDRINILWRYMKQEARFRDELRDVGRQNERDLDALLVNARQNVIELRTMQATLQTTVNATRARVHAIMTSYRELAARCEDVKAGDSAVGDFPSEFFVRHLNDLAIRVGGLSRSVDEYEESLRRESMRGVSSQDVAQTLLGVMHHQHSIFLAAAADLEDLAQCLASWKQLVLTERQRFQLDPLDPFTARDEALQRRAKSQHTEFSDGHASILPRNAFESVDIMYDKFKQHVAHQRAGQNVFGNPFAASANRSTSSSSSSSSTRRR